MNPSNLEVITNWCLKCCINAHNDSIKAYLILQLHNEPIITEETVQKTWNTMLERITESVIELYKS